MQLRPVSRTLLVLGLHRQLVRMESGERAAFDGRADDRAHMIEVLVRLRGHRVGLAMMPSVSIARVVPPAAGLVLDRDYVAVARADAEADGLDSVQYRWSVARPRFAEPVLVLGLRDAVWLAVSEAAGEAGVSLDEFGPALVSVATGERSLACAQEAASEVAWFVLERGRVQATGRFAQFETEPVSSELNRIALGQGVNPDKVVLASADDAVRSPDASAPFDENRRKRRRTTRATALAIAIMTATAALFGYAQIERARREAATAAEQAEAQLLSERDAERRRVDQRRAEQEAAAAAALSARAAPWADLLATLEAAGIGGVRVESFTFDASSGVGEVRTARAKSAPFRPVIAGAPTVRVQLVRQDWSGKEIVEQWRLEAVR